MYEIEERILAEQPTMVMHGKIRLEDIPTFLGRVYHTVDSQIREAGAHVVGDPFARYRPLDDKYVEFEVEAGLPVIMAVHGKGEVRASRLPGGPAVATVHTGPFERLESAYNALADWIADRGLKASGPAWEVYHTDTDELPGPATWRTEVIQPYRPG